jgi:predicted nucleic acid-binding protein
MPILDTQVLFALNPKDPKHAIALKIIRSRQRDLVVTDTGILEFQLVLRGRGRKTSEIRESLLALSELLYSLGVKEERTIDIDLLVSSLDIQSRNKLSYFDSLIAASALSLDGVVIGDDEAFDQVQNLKRVGLEE